MTRLVTRRRDAASGGAARRAGVDCDTHGPRGPHGDLPGQNDRGEPDAPAPPRYLARSGLLPEMAGASGAPVRPAIPPALLPLGSVDAFPDARRARETPLPPAFDVPAVALMRRDLSALHDDVRQATRAVDPAQAARGSAHAEDGRSAAPPRPDLHTPPGPGGRRTGAGVAAAGAGGLEQAEPGGHREPGGGAAAPAPATTATASGAAGATTRQSIAADDDTLDTALDAGLSAVEATALDVPRDIDVPTIAPQWEAAGELAGDVLPRPDRNARKGQAPARPGTQGPAAQGEKAGGGSNGDKGAATDAGGNRPSEREHDAEALATARSRAQRAWAELSSAARSSQHGFMDDSNRVAAYLGHAYATVAERMASGHEQGLSRLDASAAEASGDIEQAADAAELTLQRASDDTLATIQAAAASAWGAIAANEATAGTQIDRIVGGLVAGHLGAFNGVIEKARKAVETAVQKMGNWSAARNTNFPINAATRLQGAKNEKRQQRIPRLVEDDTKALNERKTTRIDGWTRTRDSTVCGLSCGYRAPLEAHRAAMHTTGREAVGSALRSAQDTLQQQVRDTRRALRQMRRSALAQVRTQQRGAAAQLTAQARAAMQATRRESLGAVQGVGGAARSALPGYWRAVQGLEGALRRAGGQGGPAIEKTARLAPDGILRGLSRTTQTLTDRLAGNRERLDTSLAHQDAGLAQGRALQLTQVEAGFSQVAHDSAVQTDTTLGGMTEACSGLAHSVTQAAASWAAPLATHFAAFITEKRAEAQTALNSLLTGGGGGSGGAGGGPAAAPAASPGAAAAPAPAAASCGACDTQAANSGGAPAGPGVAAGGGGAAGGPASRARGLTAEGDEEVANARLREAPETHFQRPLEDGDQALETDLNDRAGRVGQALESGIIDKVDEGAVTGALRGMTLAKGQALDLEIYGLNTHGATMSQDLRDKMGSGADLNAALAYLAGNNVAGARYELDASVHWYNDEESRIEATMRALSPAELAALGRADPALLNRVQDALGGTDEQVFQALRAGHYARADAYRLRDRIDEARRDGDADAVHTAIAESTAATSSGWGGRELTAEERRVEVVREIGGIVGPQPNAATTGPNGTPLTADQALTERATAYVTRDVADIDPGSGELVTRSITGANRDLAVALLQSGEGSVAARAARLGVELQRSGDPPSALNIDRAMFDERFTPDNPNATREEIDANERRRQAARAERAQALLMAAQAYGGVAAPAAGAEANTATATTNPDGTPRNPLADPGVATASDALIRQMGARFGDDDLGRRLSAGIMTDERPSAQTNSLAMQHAMYSHRGTDEEVIWRFTERLTRNEVQALRVQFGHDTGHSLDAELGVFGQGGTFTELSGDDRLRMERAMLGVATNDRERAEAAAFAIQQQRQETGSFGQWLASGSRAEEAMNATDARLRGMAGGSFDFSPEALMSGRPLLTAGNFDPTTGRYTGTGDRSAFLATTASAQQVAQNFSSRIDAYANLATTGIAILGAIAGAVITVATGGAAGPLVAAALVTGLASMGASYAIKGGRYGWEQAAVDLGMTAVQAVTAGVGAQLGAAAQVASKGAAAAAQASRTVVTLSRLFTTNPVINQIMIGAITGAISGLGTTALQEQTWEHGGGKGVGLLFEGLARGMLSGAVTATATQGLEALGGLGSRLQALSTEPGGMRAIVNMVARGAGRSLVSGTAGMAGKASELVFDAAAHRSRHIDAGDALMEIGQAGLHAAIQALGEGAAEAAATGRRAPTLHAAGEAINAERDRRGLKALAGPDLHAAAEDLLFLATHGRAPGDTAAHLEPIAQHGSLEAASVAMAAPAARPTAHAGAPADVPTVAQRPGHEEVPAAVARGLEKGPEPGAALPPPHAAAPEAAPPAFNRPATPEHTGPAATPEAAPVRPQTAEAPTAASRRSQRTSDDETSFGTAEFDALVREVRNSEFGFELETAKRRAPEPLREDTVHTRAQVDEIAHRDARNNPPPGAAPGTQIQHGTKTLSVTRDLPPGLNPLHADVINENIRPLQSRANLPATELHVDPTGGGTRYYSDDIPRGRVGDAGMRGEQLDLLTPSAGPATGVYSTEHKFEDAVRIPAAAGHTAEARRSAGLPPLDPRMLAIAAGELARWQSAGHSGTERSGRNLDLAAAASARPSAAVPPGRPSAQLALDFTGPATPRRTAVPEHEGAAAAIGGSSMRLAAEPVITQPLAALHAALAEAGGVSSLSGQLHVDTTPTPDGHVAVHLQDAAGRPLRVKVVVAATEGGDVASFRRPKPGEEGFDFVVHLSPHAPADTHARAMAHELAELRVHGNLIAADHDALRPGLGEQLGASLSAHDRGRLAELEVLARRAAALPEGPARAAVAREIEALAGHLGLLHGDDESPRMKLARAVVAKDSPAGEQLAAARRRAAEDSVADQLGPARRADPDARLSAADRRRIAEFEQAAAELAHLEAARTQPGRHTVSGEELAAQAHLEAHALRRMLDLAERMGLGGPLTRDIETELAAGVMRRRTVDTEAGTRMKLALSVLGEDSPAAARLRAMAGHVDASTNDALRPGLKPDGRSRLSEADHHKLGVLAARLQALETAVRSLPVHDLANEPPHIRRLRHEAESAAAALGLVHGQSAAARLALADAHLPGTPVLRTLLAEVSAGARGNPLLLPLTSNPGDLPLLLQQARAAMAMGDSALAGHLMQVAGLHLANSGLHGTTAAEQASAAELMRRVSLPADRALLADVVARQHDLARAPALRAEAADLQALLTRMRSAPDAEAPAQQQHIAELQARIARLHTDADAAERVALRPAGMDAEAARRFVGSAEDMGTQRRITSVVDGFDLAEQVRRVTQLHGDSPQFQSWGRAQRIHAEFFDTTGASRMSMKRDGSWPVDMMKRIARRDALFEEWAGGHYISERSGYANLLSDHPLISAVPGAQLWGQEPGSARVHLPEDSLAHVPRRNARGEAERGADGARLTDALSVRQVLDERAGLLRDNQALNAASPKDTATIQRNQTRINELSEALGEAAGRHYAETLGPEGKTHVLRGARVPDVVHVVGLPGDSDFRVTVVECKGGNADLGSAQAQQGSRVVTAEQTTPEYLRALANDMIKNGREPELARQILAALDQGPPAIQVVVVRQDASGSTALPIEVTDYPVTRSGD